jgi:hypothetical protein
MHNDGDLFLIGLAGLIVFLLSAWFFYVVNFYNP